MLIKNSELIEIDNKKVVLSSKYIVPFIYNGIIVIPKSIPQPERQIVISHELLHYKFGHHWDNILSQLIQTIFWLNPFFYFLKRELKQVHEYQVDSRIISSDIDVSIYKLALIKFSVGYQKFAIANGLTNCKIKKRIIVMNNTNSNKRKWKFLLVFPALFFFTIILSFTNTESDLLINSRNKNIINNPITDTVIIKLINVSDAENIQNIKYPDHTVVILMNKLSQIAVEHKRCSHQKVIGEMCRVFELRTKQNFGEINPSMMKNISPKIRILVQKSVNSNKTKYDNLINQIILGIYKLQEIYSNKLYGNSYKLLTKENKEKINKLIQPNIYILPDYHI